LPQDLMLRAKQALENDEPAENFIPEW